jgi:hypothetical protein
VDKILDTTDDAPRGSLALRGRSVCRNTPVRPPRLSNASRMRRSETSVAHRAAAFWAGLTEDIVTSGLRSGREDSDLLAHNDGWTGRLIGSHGKRLWHGSGPFVSDVLCFTGCESVTRWMRVPAMRARTFGQHAGQRERTRPAMRGAQIAVVRTSEQQVGGHAHGYAPRKKRFPVSNRRDPPSQARIHRPPGTRLNAVCAGSGKHCLPLACRLNRKSE